MRLLLIEDDQLLGSSLKKALGYAGYSVEWVRNGQDGADAATSDEFEIIILDVNLPSRSGFEILGDISAKKRDPAPYIIMLTARDARDDKLHGLDSGADDYITKPFDMDELLARLRAVTRRQQDKVDSVLTCRDFTMDLVTHTITPKGDGAPFIASANEFLLLSVLLRRPGQIFSKAKLEEQLYGWEGTVDSNVIEVVIYNLRRRLGKQAIITMRGVGYMVTPA